jgi:hypothetical protein
MPQKSSFERLERLVHMPFDAAGAIAGLALVGLVVAGSRLSDAFKSATEQPSTPSQPLEPYPQSPSTDATALAALKKRVFNRK